MEPTLRDGDRLLVRYDAVPRPDDLAVVRLPGTRPGEPATVAVKRVVRRDLDGWWVQRDNPTGGVDSWTVGAVSDHDVVAVVALRVWPLPGSRRPVPD
jgi:Peptidase S24-like